MCVCISRDASSSPQWNCMKRHCVENTLKWRRGKCFVYCGIYTELYSGIYIYVMHSKANSQENIFKRRVKYRRVYYIDIEKIQLYTMWINAIRIYGKCYVYVYKIAAKECLNQSLNRIYKVYNYIRRCAAHDKLCISLSVNFAKYTYNVCCCCWSRRFQLINITANLYQRVC